MLRKIYYCVLVLTLFANKSVAQTAVADRKVVVYTTAKDTDYRITPTDTLILKDFGQPVETQICVFIDPSHSFQTLVGIGGTFTDAAAETFAKLPLDKQKEVLHAYYDQKDGLGYNFARTTIHSSDFSSGSYTYVAENDKELKTFNIQHDRQFRIPLIKQALQAAGGKLTMFVSPWSPPAWMKDSKNMLRGGKLLPEFSAVWANYYVKFINAYEKEGIPIWGLSVQNEPMATQTWESCIFTAEEERDFVKFHLGPTLQKSGLSGKKLIVWDHNRDLIYQRASTIFNDPEASKYVWGIGYHWYETWTGSGMQFANVKLVNQTFPDKNLIFTEGCVEKFRFEGITDWALGERYGYSMVNDFNSGTVAWTDWNILLNEIGGPNHVGNFCYAPIIADTRDGRLLYTNSYYYIGHFSKFIKPGAKRIVASTSRDILQATAFQNTDGSISVVVLNTSEQKVPYRLWLNGKAAETTSLPHSIMTLTF
jgi:glucosylceramidase